MQATQEVTLEQLAPWLSKIGDDLTRLTWTRTFKAIALMLESSTKRNFELGQSPDGVPWMALKRPRNRPRDQAKQGGGNAQRPLRDTGALMASLTAGGKNHTEQVTESELVWGSHADYAAVHQHGHIFNRSEKRRDKPWVFTLPNGVTIFTRKIKAHTQVIPARPFVGLNQQLLDEIDDLVTDEVMRQLSGQAAMPQTAFEPKAQMADFQ